MQKNITLSTDDFLVEKARRKANRENLSLNRLFRRWLLAYVGKGEAPVRYQDLMQRLKYVEPGQTFTRDEMNAR